MRMTSDDGRPDAGQPLAGHVAHQLRREVCIERALSDVLAGRGRAHCDRAQRRVAELAGQGLLSDDEARVLDVFVRLRRKGSGRLGPGWSPHPGEHPSARPKSPDRLRSLVRRRGVAGRGLLPDGILRAFPTGGQAVLTILAEACLRSRNGCCTWPVARIAALAGVCHRLAQMAIQKARRMGLILWQERPRKGARSDTNVIEIAHPVWRNYLADKARKDRKAKPKGAKTGCKNLHTTGVLSIPETAAARRRGKGRRKKASGEAAQSPSEAWSGPCSSAGEPSPP